MSTLRKYKEDPKNIINTAFNMYRARKIKTAVVEGCCDKRFLGQWVKSSAPVRFDGFAGKSLVEEVLKQAERTPYSGYSFLYYFVDVDFDLVVGDSISQNPHCTYHAYCHDQKKVIYNDLESYLINTHALDKVLTNFDVDVSEVGTLREKLEKASRETGSLRAADLVLIRKKLLNASILDGMEIEPYFDAKKIEVNIEKLKMAIPRWSKHKEFVSDLFEEAERLKRSIPTPWTLSRGHDLTEMLTLHLESRGIRGYSRERLELLLRLACEYDEFASAPMFKRLLSNTEWGDYIRLS